MTENALKALSETDDEIRVGNYMVLWGNPSQRDLTWVTGQKNADGTGGEYFAPDTDFESIYTKAGRLEVDWEHRQDKKGPGDEVLGYVDWTTAKADAVGLWAERVLYRRSRYMQFLEEAIKAGLIGNSTEALPTAERGPDGKIVRWPLFRDSLTVNPMEPRMMTGNQVQALKALLEASPHLKSLFPGLEPEAEEPPQAEKSAGVKEEEPEPDDNPANGGLPLSVTITDTSPQKTGTSKGEEMADESNTQNSGDNAALQTLQTQMDNLSKSVEKILEQMQNEPAVRKSGYYTDDGGKQDQNVKSFADFLLAVQRNDETRLKSVYNTRKAALNEASGEAGGYLVPTEYNTQLLQVGITSSPILQLVKSVPINSDAGEWPALDQFAAPTAGVGDTAFAAGVKVAKRSEQGTPTESEPTFEMIRWRLNDVGGYTQVTNNLMSDSPQAIESLLTTLFGIAIAAKKEYYILRGNGVGEPLGILNANAALSISAAASNTFAYVDAVQMASRFKKLTSNARWVMHQSTVPDFAGSSWVRGNSILNLSDLGFGDGILSEHLPQADNANHVVLIDFGAYLFFEKGGTEVAFSEHYAFLNRRGTWRFNVRMDGQPWMKDKITLADPQGSYTVSPFILFGN